MKVGIFLSGEGADIIALAGALQALFENAIKADFICGSGTAALVAALFSVGYSPEDLKDLLPRYLKLFYKKNRLLDFLKFHKKFKKKGNRAAYSLCAVEKALIRDLERAGARRLSHTAIPLLLPAVDLPTGRLICFVSDGSRFISGGMIEYISRAPLSKAAIAAMAPSKGRSGLVFGNYVLSSASHVSGVCTELLRLYGADSVISVTAVRGNTGAQHDCNKKPGENTCEKADYSIFLKGVERVECCFQAGYDTVEAQINNIIVSVYLKD